MIFGFIASLNSPNKKSIGDIIAFAEKNEKVNFLIAGQITRQVKKKLKNVKLIAKVSGKEFYDNCDVIINTDTFISGIKIKCVEALSFGKPLLCTEVASRGLNSNSKFHNVTDSVAFFDMVQSVSRYNIEILKGMQESSVALYDSYYYKYSYEKLWDFCGVNLVCE